MTMYNMVMISEKAYRDFNLTGKGIKIEGGQGNSYLFGDIFVKKNDGDNRNIDYISRILSEIKSNLYRVPRPLKSNNGTYISDGYIAAYYVEGKHDFNDLERVMEISREFHRDISIYDPGLMRQEDTQWAMAMDILFRDREIPEHVDEDNMEKCICMLNKLESFEEPLQIIHADIGGNIIYNDGQLPCIIDFSPCIAPAPMAEAIAVVDHIAWEGKDISALGLLEPVSKYLKYIRYAVMFRLLSALCSKTDSNDLFRSEYNAYIGVWNHL